MRSGPGPRALNAVIGAPRANVGVLRAAFRGPRWSQTGHATTGPAGVAGHCESANLSQRVAINLLHSQCERFSGTVRVGESVPVAHSESVREGLGMRSPLYPSANSRLTQPALPKQERVFRFLRGIYGVLEWREARAAALSVAFSVGHFGQWRLIFALGLRLASRSGARVQSRRGLLVNMTCS
jgi:hypothetical protein